jgi:hypothetical protein
MKAITIRQPWAQLIIDGRKDVENRDWRTKHRGAILIHASTPSHVDVSEQTKCAAFMRSRGLGVPPLIPADARGAALGICFLLDCVCTSDSPWFTGGYGLVLSAPLKFEKPIAMKGALGIWETSEVHARAISEAWDLAIFEQGRKVRIAAGQEVACRGCGCSESRACVGGCGWYSEGWCTACQDKAELQELYKAVQGGQR